MTLKLNLNPGKKVYFASDFHLGIPNAATSLEREKKIVRWLDTISSDAEAIFLLGDVFDFWYEYKKVIPKGFVRFQGKLAQLADEGLKIYLFTGNHDLWMYDYFPQEFGIPVYRNAINLQVNETKFIIGHGDGLGPGDHKYKLLKKIFNGRLNQKLYSMLHPNIGLGLGHRWSRHSQLAKSNKEQESYGEKEHLLVYCKEQEALSHNDYYIFGHRHLTFDMEVAENSRYLNSGEWVNNANYIVFDGKTCEIVEYKG